MLAVIALLGAAACAGLVAVVLGRDGARIAGDVLSLGRSSSTQPTRRVELGLLLTLVRGAARAVPARLGPYLLAEKIGEGAMGQVFRARHTRSGAWRAVKVLARGATARDRQRFAAEAALGARIRHDSAVAIYDSGETRDGRAYYAMELVEGASLQQVVEREGALAPERAVRVALELCAALAAVHARGLVHRDVKPDNVLVYRAADGTERVKLIDFGLVKDVSAAGADGSDVVGTPLYLAPEAITAPESVSARSDLYALGAVLYFSLSGAPVFDGRSVVEVCCQHLHSAPARLAARAPVSAELERVVLECLAKDPAARPASAAELAERLARCAASGVRAARVTRLVPRREARDVSCAAAA
jgi:serine/threonine-protein kinase